MVDFYIVSLDPLSNDLSGLKVSVSSAFALSPIDILEVQLFFTSRGAHITNMPFAELLPALERGIIDAYAFPNDGDYGPYLAEITSTSGLDLLIYTVSDGQIVPYDPNEIIVGTSGDDVLAGGGGDDQLFGGGGDDDLRGGGGNDLLRGGSGNDVLRGGPGQDRLIGGPGEDQLLGGGGGDVLVGGGDDDVLRGGGGNDVLRGGGGQDRLFGGPGEDVLLGGGGNDVLRGGLDKDRFVLQPHGGNDVVVDFQNDLDRLDFRAFDFADKASVLNLATQVGAKVVFGLPGGETVELINFDLNLLGAEDIVI